MTGHHRQEKLSDDQGYTLWHYWAHSPRPHQTFDELLAAFGKQECDRLSVGQEHPWHFLLLSAQTPAMEAWSFSMGIPTEPTRSGENFSHCAAWSGQTGILEVFGNQQLDSINQPDAQGLTPLMIAIHRGDESFVHSFLMAGADPMVTDSSGRTALHHAAQYGDAALVALLEDVGGDAQARDLQGLSAANVLKTRRQVPPRELHTLREHWHKRKSMCLPF